MTGHGSNMKPDMRDALHSWAASLALICAAIISSAPLASPAHAATPAAPKCTADEYRRFDFWLGDWDSFDIDNGNTRWGTRLSCLS